MMGQVNEEAEKVVLLDETGQPTGLAPKSEVHTGETPLHRGFSAFVFDSRGRLLLQQRSAAKLTWPLTWSNSACGHPAWGESAEGAAKRRLAYELGLTEVALEVVLPDFRYRAERGGIVENELCPVLVGVTAQPVRRNPDEVADTRWVDWPEFVSSVRNSGEARTRVTDLSPWCVEETLLLDDRADLPHILARLGASAHPTPTTGDT